MAAGAAEIGGGWLVWQAVRLHKGWWMALVGSLVLVCYGLIPCAQPVDNFGRVRSRAPLAGLQGGVHVHVLVGPAQLRRLRLHPTPQPPTGPLLPPSTQHTNQPQVYAVYGAFFIVLSYLWGWAVDGVRPDAGDWTGSAIAVAGGCIAFFWPGR